MGKILISIRDRSLVLFLPVLRYFLFSLLKFMCQAGLTVGLYSVAIFLLHANTDWRHLTLSYLRYPAVDQTVSQVPDQGVLLAQHLRALQHISVLLAGLKHSQLPQVHLHGLGSGVVVLENVVEVSLLEVRVWGCNVWGPTEIMLRAGQWGDKSCKADPCDGCERSERYFYLGPHRHPLTLSMMSCMSQGITDTSADCSRNRKTKQRPQRMRMVEGPDWPSSFLITGRHCGLESALSPHTSRRCDHQVGTEDLNCGLRASARQRD